MLTSCWAGTLPGVEAIIDRNRGRLLATVFWLARGNMWNIVLVAVALTLVMLVGPDDSREEINGGNSLVMLRDHCGRCYSFHHDSKARLAGCKTTEYAARNSDRPRNRHAREGDLDNDDQQIARAEEGDFVSIARTLLISIRECSLRVPATF